MSWKDRNYNRFRLLIEEVIAENPGFFGLVDDKYMKLRKEVVRKMLLAVKKDDLEQIKVLTGLWSVLDIRK